MFSMEDIFLTTRKEKLYFYLMAAQSIWGKSKAFGIYSAPQKGEHLSDKGGNAAKLNLMVKREEETHINSKPE